MKHAATTSRDRGRKGRIGLWVAAIVVGGFLACAGGPGAPPGAVHVLTAKGTVNPIMQRYIDRGIGAAEDEKAAAVVIRLNTPGGLSSSMDDIDRRILNAKVPVVTYVWPSGGQAASAGTFIAYASHIAAMAPGTVIGSATPVDASGDDIQGDLRNKVIENAVAKIKGFANRHGRNAEWGERAVRDGISATAEEALSLGVVDAVAPDLEALLQAIDGRQVSLEGGAKTVLTVADAPVVYNDRNFVEDFLDIIADPNIAFLLLSLGSLALFIEIVNPGQIFPGVFGVISLLLGFFALSVLPFNWAGVGLIFFAFILFGLELFVTSHGILGIGGAVALVLGGLILTSGNPPDFQVSKWLVFTLGAVLAVWVIFVMVNILRIRRMPAKTGMETLLGRTAVARSPLEPTGFVFIDGEYWRAESVDGNIQPGEKVVVTEVAGLKLKVRRQ